MKMEEMAIPEDFDWVTARAECSLASVFELLKTAVGRDVDTRHAMPATGNGFAFVPEHNTFLVIHSAPNERHTVKFTLESNAIAVTFDDKPILTGSVTLCDDGVCRIAVEGQPVAGWQFRRRALERLFFGA